MRWLISACLNQRVLVTALAVAVMIAGLRMGPKTPLDVFPEFSPPLVEIQTEAPGLSTPEVESLISVPIENAVNGNTLEVTRGVEAVIDSLRPGLTDVDIDTTIFRPATFIEMSLANLRSALLWGCVLVIVILAAFLFEWRTAVISLTAIPLSLLGAALVLSWRGGTINTMVLAGLAIALGEVVDDAIIDVENIVRRLRLNRAAGNPEPALNVVLDASLEVRSAVVYASLIVVLVFLPVIMLEGLAGSFFRPLALSYVLAVLTSLLVALTVTPALSLIRLPRSRLASSGTPRWCGRSSGSTAASCPA